MALAAKNLQHQYKDFLSDFKTGSTITRQTMAYFPKT
jgi:hypothetical protein